MGALPWLPGHLSGHFPCSLWTIGEQLPFSNTLLNIYKILSVQDHLSLGVGVDYDDDAAEVDDHFSEDTDGSHQLDHLDDAADDLDLDDDDSKTMLQTPLILSSSI